MVFSVRKDLILVALAGTVVVMGLGLIIPLFPIHVSQEGVTIFQLGLIVSGFTIRMFGFSSPVPNLSGMVADRYGEGFLFLIGADSRGLAIGVSSARSPELSKTVKMVLTQPDWAMDKESRDSRGYARE